MCLCGVCGWPRVFRPIEVLDTLSNEQIDVGRFLQAVVGLAFEEVIKELKLPLDLIPLVIGGEMISCMHLEKLPF